MSRYGKQKCRCMYGIIGRHVPKWLTVMLEAERVRSSLLSLQENDYLFLIFQIKINVLDQISVLVANL